MHCSPKCGHNLTALLFKDIICEKNINYRCLVARNPFTRLVSLWANKIIAIDMHYIEMWGINPRDYDARSKALTDEALRQYRLDFIGDLGKEIKDTTFKDFCSLITDEVAHLGEPHLRKQTYYYQPEIYPSLSLEDYLNDVIFIEDLPECLEIPAKALNMPLESVSPENIQKNRGPFITPKSDKLNLLENAWDIKVSEWWDHGALPSNYRTLYNDDLIDYIYERYEDDFTFFKLGKDF